MNKILSFFKDWKNQKNYAAWLMQYSKPYLFKISMLLFMNIAVMLLSVEMAVVSKSIIDKASSGMKVIDIIILYIALMAVMLIFNVISQLVSLNLNEKFSFGIRKQIYERIMNADWIKVNKYHSGDIMTRLTSDATAIAKGIITTIPTIVLLFVELLVTFFTLFYYEPSLAIFALLIAPVSAVISVWFGRKLKKLHVKVQESESKYRSFMQESIANLLIIKAFSNEDRSVEHLAELRDERFKWIYKKNIFGIVSSTTLSVSFQVGYIVAFTYGAICLSNNAITYGTMALFLTLINRVQSPIINLAKEIPGIVSVLASAGRVMELQDIPLETRNDEMIAAERIGVEALGLNFAYNEEAGRIFNDAELSIRPGEFVALIGESGIGKTTLIRLLMSFINNYDGNIFFVNEAGEKLRANAGAREFMSYVPQGNTLFSGTIKDNILMGKTSATDEEIEEAIRIADATDFINKLPCGVDTVIGERGHGISEGQAQRIAIARAVIKKAPFLVLDEATSSLDSETELHVLQGLRNMSPKPTCLIVTHRESVLAYCDRQIKIDAGSILL